MELDSGWLGVGHDPLGGIYHIPPTGKDHLNVNAYQIRAMSELQYPGQCDGRTAYIVRTAFVELAGRLVRCCLVSL